MYQNTEKNTNRWTNDVFRLHNHSRCSSVDRPAGCEELGRISMLLVGQLRRPYVQSIKWQSRRANVLVFSGGQPSRSLAGVYPCRDLGSPPKWLALGAFHYSSSLEAVSTRSRTPESKATQVHLKVHSCCI